MPHTRHATSLSPPNSTPVPSKYRPGNLFSTAIAQHVSPRLGEHATNKIFMYFNSSGYINMTPPKYQEVVEDCDAALKLDSKYLKALNRRAMAFEGLEKWEEALRGELGSLPGVVCGRVANAGHVAR